MIFGKKIIIKNEEEMMMVAEEAAKILVKKEEKRKGALMITLEGELGAGKTTFARGFLKALGVKRKITSPTFVLIKKYSLLKKTGFLKAYHADAYRLKDGDLEILGWREILENPENVVLVEWPERVREARTTGAVKIKFKHLKEGREVEIKNS
ncbi:MAG: tRNA (adenosine(37)-N6)-threonylcarbamoyltransferase complex ATPase subunit type 1 TsaE [Candidatus Liptonbacteria bacterium RIFOXYD1_FULL_36_11]|uniref:tRNA threonylcarbamoyladenosine biosynthesis protein TsaE n=1 Tax=Candidatus Liptonbacteria bacterium RIFOXYD1_FULL_36_11 TaxID=1798656 RepID=A0A1G2CPH2_9BACT|nr:MAG: tRNA (adenosine(37)-N6)-threonylcarbamoyltransferase complex ATPase subunit type 1 TsaE [Candidatus Liptonbacteria bacterium RIFOXYD1_FULL_36_11]